jgi:hypothetical protein
MNLASGNQAGNPAVHIAVYEVHHLLAGLIVSYHHVEVGVDEAGHNSGAVGVNQGLSAGGVYLGTPVYPGNLAVFDHNGIAANQGMFQVTGKDHTCIDNR